MMTALEAHALLDRATARLSRIKCGSTSHAELIAIWRHIESASDVLAETEGPACAMKVGAVTELFLTVEQAWQDAVLRLERAA